MKTFPVTPTSRTLRRPLLCRHWEAEFSVWITIEGKPRNLGSRSFCLKCTPFGTHNTRDIRRPKATQRPKVGKRGNKPHVPIPIERMLIQNSPHSRQNIKKRLMNLGVLENVCAICRLEPKWNGKPLHLRLDHKNGVNNDYRLENLRLLCPNCDSQTETYCGRNRKRKRKMGRDVGIEPTPTKLELVALPLS